jgi:glycosyltransferase involved in cell wall biosynthesis
LNILMVHPHDLWYDPWTIRILELGRGLQRHGHRVTLCHLPRREKPKHPPLRQAQPDDPPVYELLPRQQNFVHNFNLLYRLAQDCDVVHLQKCFAAAALPVLWVCRLQNKPLHYDWDDNETAISRKVEKRFLSRLQLSLYEMELPHFADSLSYSSKAIQELALRRGFPEAQMWHIPVGADVTRFYPGDAEPGITDEFQLIPHTITVLYIGQLEGAAHARQLVEAAPLVVKNVPNVQFVIAGGGEQLEDLREAARRSPARDLLRIPGYVQADKIPALVRAADICVACFDNTEASRAKSPLKVAEYLASGRAIVASRVGDVPWMVHDCGITIKPDSVEELAQGIIAYAHDEQRRFRDGQKARKRAEELFTWERGVQTLLEAYQAGLNRGS